jgi:DNA-binding beta-propeller fold protein YncE
MLRQITRSLEQIKRAMSLLAMALAILAPGLVMEVQATPILKPVIQLTRGSYFPHGLINPATNKLYLPETYSDGNHSGTKLLAIDPSTASVQSVWNVDGQNAYLLGINAAKNQIYVTWGQNLVAIDGDSGAQRTLAMPLGAFRVINGLAINQLTNKIYATSVGSPTIIFLIDGETLTVVTSVTMGHPVSKPVVNENDGMVYVASTNSNAITAVATVTDLNGKSSLSLTDYPAGFSRIEDVHVDSSTNKLYYGPYPEGGMKEMDLANPAHSLTSLAVTPPVPLMVDVNPITNKVYVLTAGPKVAGRSLAILDRVGGTNESVDLGDEMWWMKVNSVSDKVYAIGNSTLSVFDGITKQVTKFPISYDNLTSEVIINPANGRAYLRNSNTLSEIADEPASVVDAIEVTQSVQDLAQSVPLIASKSTMVRVYAHSSSSTPIAGTLTAVAGATSVRIQSTGTMVPSNDALPARRADLSKSLNFVLPDSVTGRGRIRLELTALGGTSFGANGCPGCARDVTFEPTLEMRVRAVPFRYQLPGYSKVQPRAADIDELQSWLQRAYPISKLDYSTQQVAYTGPLQTTDPYFDCTNVNAQLINMRNQEVSAGRDARTHYYGLVYWAPAVTFNGSFFMRGCANYLPVSADPSAPASGPAYIPFAGSWDVGAPSVAGWYGGHELGHTLGRQHAGPVAGHNPAGDEVAPCPWNSTEFCTSLPCGIAVGPDHNYPYSASQLAGANLAPVGYDEGDATHTRRAMASPTWHDIMSYCDYEWLTDYTYRAAMNRLRDEDALPSRPPAPPVARVASLPSAATNGAPTAAAGQPASAGQPPVLATGDFITIVGTANLTRRTGSIRFVHRVGRASVRTAAPDSPVRLRLIDRSDRTITELPAPFLPSTDRQPDKDLTGVFDAVVSPPAALKAVELMVGGNVAARYEAPDTVRIEATEIRTAPVAPAAQGVTPGAAETDLRLEWGRPAVAGAPATPGVSYDVQASRDGGQTWEVLANGLSEPAAEVDLSSFPGKGPIDVRVIGNAGFQSLVIARRRIER